MALLKFRCADCGAVFDELVSPSRMNDVRCADCGGKRVERAYEGKCLFGMSGSSAGRGASCSGHCEGCSGCGGHHAEGCGCGGA